MSKQTTYYRMHHIGASILSELTYKTEQWLNDPNPEYKKIISTHAFHNGTMYVYTITYIPTI